jgi:hypothetical protein
MSRMLLDVGTLVALDALGGSIELRRAAGRKRRQGGGKQNDLRRAADVSLRSRCLQLASRRDRTCTKLSYTRST